MTKTEVEKEPLPCGHIDLELWRKPMHIEVTCGECGRKWKADVSIGGTVAFREVFDGSAD